MKIRNIHILRSWYWQWKPIKGGYICVGNIICLCHLHIGYLLICTPMRTPLPFQTVTEEDLK